MTPHARATLAVDMYRMELCRGNKLDLVKVIEKAITDQIEEEFPKRKYKRKEKS